MRRILFVTLAVSIALALLHFAALEWYLYWRFLWYDILMHFLGGLCLGLFAYWLLSRVSIPTFIMCISCVALVGIAWEVFEFVTKFPPSFWMSYPLDTMKDLTMDLVGGIGGFLVARRMV